MRFSQGPSTTDRSIFAPYLLGIIEISLLMVTNAGAQSAPLQSRLALCPPLTDGAIDFGEWPMEHRLKFDHGFLTIMNDQHRMYLLVNVTGDLINDTEPDLDTVGLEFDIDENGAPTPGLDRYYTQEPSTGNLRYRLATETRAWSELQPRGRSSQAKGFGAFFADETYSVSPSDLQSTRNQHRVWEFAIDLNEINTHAGGSTRLRVTVNSATSQIESRFPDSKDPNLLIQFSGQPPLVIQEEQSALDKEDLTLSLHPLEVIQAIQTRDNELPLVADKPTVARVYVNPAGGLSIPHSVTVELYGSRARC